MSNYELTLSGDGSNTLFNKHYNQHYHSTKDGAVIETLHKHILPALFHHQNKHELNVLDICFGLGYNTFLTILENKKLQAPKKINFYSPELDETLVKSLSSFEYPPHFNEIKHIIDSVCKNNFYEDSLYKIELYIGNARDYICSLEDIDIVYQDAFSSDVNSELWSFEYFEDIYKITNENMIITTYSTATNVRLSMSENGFFIYEHQNNITRKSTLGFKKLQNYPNFIDMELKKQRNPNACVIKDTQILYNLQK